MSLHHRLDKENPENPYSDNDSLYSKLAKINGIENIDSLLNPLSI